MDIDRFLESFAWMTRDTVIVIYSPAQGVEGAIVWCNPASSKQFGLAAEDLIGKPISILFEPVQYRKMLDEIRPHQIEGETGANAEVLCKRADGSTYWGTLQILYAPRDEKGGRISAGIIRDISALKRREDEAAQALEQREAMTRQAEALWSRLLLAIDSLDTPMGIWDKDLRLVLCNKALGPLLIGRDLPSEPKIRNQDFLREVAHSGQILSAVGREDEWIATVQRKMIEGQINDLEEFSDGRTFLTKSEQSANGDMVIHMIDMTEGIARETELSQKNQELERAEQAALQRANLDDLTGLGNRRSVVTCLETIVAREGLGGDNFAVLQIDLDRFKQINDTLGHAAGDHVLIVVGERLAELVEATDHLARIGGDEFVIICTGTDVGSRTSVLGEQVVESLCRPIKYKENTLPIGASVGIAMTPLSSAADLLVHADVALYRSKSEGRGTVRVFNHDDLDEMRRAKAECDEILVALEAGQFVPWYQPQVDAETGKIVGLEALARWDHPKRGVLPPSVFIQHADDLNVLGELDRQIFEQSIEECSIMFRDIAPLDLSINVSEERLMSSDLDAIITQATSYNGHVSIELLETIFLEDRSETFRFQIDRMREAGLGIQLDDFGSGRASIVALEQIAPDRLKIDRRLVGAVATSKRSARLVEAIVEIGAALDIKVTAEGVEAACQVEPLKQLGCDRLQGFLFGEPMPLSQVVETFDLGPARGTGCVA